MQATLKALDDSFSLKLFNVHTNSSNETLPSSANYKKLFKQECMLVTLEAALASSQGRGGTDSQKGCFVMGGDFNIEKPHLREAVTALMESAVVVGKDLAAVSTLDLERITHSRTVYGKDNMHAVEFFSVLLASSQEQESSPAEAGPSLVKLEDYICLSCCVKCMSRWLIDRIIRVCMMQI